MSERVAAALGYRAEQDQAPRLLAKGKGYVADKIIEVARDHDTPIYKDERLSRQLQNMSVGETIPEDLYNVVAEVLVFISRMDARYKRE